MSTRIRTNGKGQNTESFDKSTSLVTPDMRVLIGNSGVVYDNVLSNDDVIITPNFFCDKSDLSLYKTLLQEMQESQEKKVKDSEYIPWHEGSHSIIRNPSESSTFQTIIQRLIVYFDMDPKSISTRFNYYKDGQDWKPLHHDSAAFNSDRAQKQNITIGVSFGYSRDLCFSHAKNKTRLNFPQDNGMVFSFGKNVNIRFMHGVNALPPDASTDQGRISIIIWGNSNKCKDGDSLPLINNKVQHNRSFHKNHNRVQHSK